MAVDTSALERRLDEEFSRSREKLDRLRRESVRRVHRRHERLERFETICESLAAILRPRIDVLRRRLGDRIRVTPRASVGRRQATLDFRSDLAWVRLVFGAATDADVGTLVLDYGLEILPALTTYPDRSRLEMPFDRIDPKAMTQWIDDRIVDFTRTYLSLRENEIYLAPHMVEDPVARVRFPRFAAAATLKRDGNTLYFIANETREEFQAAETKPTPP